MPQQLPPLNALKAFEAVARHRSFTKASEELYVTRAAISHQVKHLEEFLGFPLVERHNRAISLTKAGEAALPKLREGFNSLADAVSLMRSQVSVETLSVWMAPSFASKWCVPRLYRFSQQYPEISLRISGESRLVDASENTDSLDELFRSNDIDVMIRFGTGSYSDCLVDKLFSVEAVPLCHPSLLRAAEHPLKTPADLRYHTLLHDDTPYIGRPSWDRWLKLAKVEDVDSQRGIHFNQISLAMGAAIDGQGVLLSMDELARYDIEAGRLCIPFPLSMPLDHAYYVIRPQSASTNLDAVNAFVTWILAEAQTEDAFPGIEGRAA
ncbi:MAG: transcriptional regulator GcvA [Thiothrix sp.]|nr:transcriptional regulator GcvA [Thiothrix sp.]HPE59189.1 transcriptional regulator GcvA [Thiolinea sp.]